MSDRSWRVACSSGRCIQRKLLVRATVAKRRYQYYVSASVVTTQLTDPDKMSRSHKQLKTKICLSVYFEIISFVLIILYGVMTIHFDMCILDRDSVDMRFVISPFCSSDFHS